MYVLGSECGKECDQDGKLVEIERKIGGCTIDCSYFSLTGNSGRNEESGEEVSRNA